MFEKFKNKVKSIFHKPIDKVVDEKKEHKKEETVPNLKEGEKRSTDTVKVHPESHPETPWIVNDMSKTQVESQTDQSKINAK